MITALGKTWHPEHFTCNHCNQELGTRNFFERDGHPYCEPDYHNLFSPRCAYCNGAILDVNLHHLHSSSQRDYIPIFFFLYCRNASPLWRRHGTRNISSALNAARHSAKMVSMNVMASHIVGTIISICLHQSVMVAIEPLWKIIFRL